MMPLFGEMLECPFCALSEDKRSPVWEHLFPDDGSSDVLLRTGSFSVVLDTAPLTEGHLLVVSNEHYPSMATAGGGERRELLALKAKTTECVDLLYGSSTYFEHGALNFTRHAGACVDHAHLHIVPGRHDILGQIAQDYPGVSAFPSYADGLAQLQGSAYLMFGSNELGHFGAEAPACQTQYLRRLVAITSKNSHLWNWRDCVRWADTLTLRDRLTRTAETIRNHDSMASG